MAQRVKDLTTTAQVAAEVRVGSTARHSGLRIWHCCKLLPRSQMCFGSGWWLWHRAAAIVLIQPLAWEHPYAPGVAVKKKKKKSTNNKC